MVAGGFDSDEVTFGTAQLTISDGLDMFVLHMGDAEVGMADAPVTEAGVLYPNPGTGTFILEGLHGIRTVEVLNSMGTLVCRARVHAAQGRITVHVPGLTSGHYLVQAVGDGRTVLKKMVVQ